MGLNREVRDFFTNRISKVLDNKLAEINKGVDEKKVKQEAIARFCKKWEIENLQTRWQKNEQQIKTAEDEKKKLQDEVGQAMRKSGESYGSYTTFDFSYIERTAEREFEADVMAELYPNVVPQIKKIELMKEDVQSAVLLATTEPVLVKTLTSLLTNYGGEIKELLALIPKA